MNQNAITVSCSENFYRGLTEHLQIYRVYNSPTHRIEKFGDRLITSIFEPSIPTKSIHVMLAELDIEIFIYRMMYNRGSDPHSEQQLIKDKNFKDINPPPLWKAGENGINYIFKSDQGKSYGLFIDQRENRKRVQDMASGKKVLNLFSYTGGFGLAAVKGNCIRVENIDTSQKTLDWLQENVRENDFNNSICSSKKIDSIDYLNYCQRTEIKFDLVILDPPSFSRGKSKVFKLDKSWNTILDSISNILNPDGTILFSCNLEKWSQNQFEKEMTSWSAKRFKIIDFPKPTWDSMQPPQTMKSVFFNCKLT